MTLDVGTDASRDAARLKQFMTVQVLLILQPVRGQKASNVMVVSRLSELNFEATICNLLQAGKAASCLWQMASDVMVSTEVQTVICSLL